MIPGLNAQTRVSEYGENQKCNNNDCITRLEERSTYSLLYFIVEFSFLCYWN